VQSMVYFCAFVAIISGSVKSLIAACFLPSDLH